VGADSEYLHADQELVGNDVAADRGVGHALSQYLVMGTPWTSSMTKYGRPDSVAPTSRTRAMLRWSIIARAWRSASKRAITWKS